YVVPAPGGTPRKFPGKSDAVIRPSWANAGKMIVFSDRGENDTPEIKRDLTTAQLSAVPDSTNLRFPVCSPDGRFIAATDNDGTRLMLFDFTTQKWSELIKMSVGLSEWSADGKYLYFDTGLSADPAV